jgi:hypothetical protein
MSEDLSTVDDAQLARWAYGRPGDASETERARRAAAELDRRTADRRAASSPEVVTPLDTRPLDTRPLDTDRRSAAAAGPVVDGQAPEAEQQVSDDAPRPPRRLLIVAAAGLLGIALVAGIALPPLLASAPTTSSSLAVFEREDSTEEREYLTLLLRQGQSVSAGPRVLGTIEYGTVLAYGSMRDDPGQPERDQICLAIAEFDRAAQSPVIADRQCLDRGEFDAAGASMTLYGIGGQYDVDWGPRGRAQLDVLITEAQRRAMDPGIEGVFLDLPETADDLRYLTEQLLVEQTGLAVEQLRRIFPVPTLVNDTSEVGGPTVTSQTEWVAAYTAVPMRPLEQGESGGAPDALERVACLAVVADGVQRESRCVAFADIGSRGMLLEFEREGRTILISWSPTGEISAQTATAE